MKKVKFQLERKRFVKVEVSEDKLHIVQENNREVWREAKRIERRESMYSADEMLENVQDTAPSAEDAYIERQEKKEELRKLKQAVMTLTPKQRKIIHSHFWKKKSLREIAREMGVHHSSVEESYKAAVSKLKKFFEEN